MTASRTGSNTNVLKEIRAMRQASFMPSLAVYNAALYALNLARTIGTPIALSLELYNEMIARNIVPNTRTYENVIRALCERDADIQKLLSTKPLSSLAKERALFGRPEVPEAVLSETAQQLKEEPNFQIAMTLFNTASSTGNALFPTDTYNQLLRSASFHGDVDSALTVYAHLEIRKDILPNLATFNHLLGVYGAVGDLEGAREVFKEFLAAGQHGRFGFEFNRPSMTNQDYKNLVRRSNGPIQLYVKVFNKMISVFFQCGEPAGALALFEAMIRADNTSPRPGEMPSASAETYTAIINGFCDSGDLDSAIAWFERMSTHKVSADGLDPIKAPLRPTRAAWLTIFKALSASGRLEDINRLFSALIAPLPDSSLQLRPDDIHRLLAENTRFLLSDQARKDIKRSSALIQFLNENRTRCIQLASLSFSQQASYDWLVARALVNIGALNEALITYRNTIDFEIDNMYKQPTSNLQRFYVHGFNRAVNEFAEEFMGINSDHPRPTFDQALLLFRHLARTPLEPSVGMQAGLVRVYQEAKQANNDLTFLADRPPWAWKVIVAAFCKLEKVMRFDDAEDQASRQTAIRILGDEYPGLESFLRDAAAVQEQSPASWWLQELTPMYRVLSDVYGPEVAENMLLPLGEVGQKIITQAVGETSELSAQSMSIGSPVVTPGGDAEVYTDFGFSARVESALNNGSLQPATLCQETMALASKGRYPRAETLARLIASVGKNGLLEQARNLYSVAQTVLTSMADDLEGQRRGWFRIEDAMIQAHAFSNDFQSADLHRSRILEQGGMPSADAYAVMIMKVQDFTDDCSIALGYYNEARSLGVQATAFLYNNIIAKLARARKADTAMSVFQDMRLSRVTPTSVTFGALIGACCRVGDAESAEYLFNEMSSQVNFKPKAPPFNTMIQFFVHTKPDRNRALHYFNLMTAARVKPTAHTYKVRLIYSHCVASY